MSQQTYFHPMNQPYINQQYTAQRRTSNNSSGQSFTNNNNHSNNMMLPTYESQRLLQYSNASSVSERNQNKQMYSRSSTNIVVGESVNGQQVRYSSSNVGRQEYERNSYGGEIQRGQSRQTVQHSMNYNHYQQPTSHHTNTITQHQQQYQQYQSPSTNILHQKIHFLQKQLQQLTRLLHEQSKHSYGSSLGQDYEEVAIENAQLTIQVKELQENLAKEVQIRQKLQKELIDLGQEYQHEHKVNNELRQKLIQMNNKVNSLEKQLNQSRKQQSSSTNSISNLQQKNSYSATLQRQNTRLTQQIQTLLSKLHNLNLEINQQQASKQQLMSQMNQQLKQIQTLRKELSDQEVEKLQLQSMNQYLKQEIAYVNQLATKKQKELQEKYIREDVERSMKDLEKNIRKGGLEQENQQLIKQVKVLKRQISTLNHQIQSQNHQIQQQHNQIQQQQHKINQQTNQISQLNTTISQLNSTILQLKRKPTTPPKQPFKQLFSQTEQTLTQQIRFLQHQLTQQKSRLNQLTKKYQQTLSSQENTIDQLERENRRLTVQNRTLKIENQDRRKEVYEAREECEKLEEKVEEIKSSKSLAENNSSYYGGMQRDRYEQKIKLNNQMNKRLLQQKQQQIIMYTDTIRTLQLQLTSHRSQLSRLSHTLQLKQKELTQKDYLVQELHQLQERHEQLIDEVRVIKKSKNTMVEQWGIKEETIKRETLREVEKLRGEVVQRDKQINNLQRQIERLINENQDLSAQMDRLTRQFSSKQSTIQTTTNHNQSPLSPTSCPLCPQVLKQFNVYKQLMQLKFQTMNQMLDQLKISFIRAQFQIRDQIHKDKSKYDHWMQQYDTHDKEYRTLMERLWEWEKIQARNDMVEGVGIKQGLKVQKQQLYHQNNKSNPAPHLSEIEYDLYLIKLQNSTLRSQIVNLQKELSQKNRSPQNQKQIQQLKKYSENLTLQNEELKQHLNQVIMSQKKLGSARQMTFGNMNMQLVNNNNNIKRESIFERYSSMTHINTELQERARQQEKTLASAQLLINKLKKQNDNLIEVNRHLQSQLDKQITKHRQLITQLQTERQRTHNQIPTRSSYHNNPNLQLIDRNNIPFEYIRHHPQHKRLQQDFVALKRSYLEMELEFRKVKEIYQEEIQKMKVENQFHLDRIRKLQEKELELMKGSIQNGTIFSFNHTSNQLNNNTTTNHSSQLIKVKQNALSISLSQQAFTLTQTKIKTLQQRVLYLQKQVELKSQQCQSYITKYEELMKQLSYHPRTPRSSNHLNRIQKLAENIEVSPIQSPQWQTHSAQQQQHSDRFFTGESTINFESKLVDKLKTCMDKKMIELQITPRESSNILVKATWFIERLTNDIKELRNNVEILKGQRKAIMKERNQLKEQIQNGEIYQGVKQSEQQQKTGSLFAKKKDETHKHEKILFVENQLSYVKNNKIQPQKLSSQNHNIPKLQFDSSESPVKSESLQSNENQLPDVIRETLELKNQRRSHLKKFQKQLEVLAGN